MLSRRAAMAWLAVAIATVSAARAAGPGPVDFAREVAPVLERSCLGCHRPGNAKGEISLAGPADLVDYGHVVAGMPGESTLLELVGPGAEGKKPRMPKAGEPLSAGEVELLRRWIAEGAAWPEGLALRDPNRAGPDWWAFRPLSDAQPPDPPGLPEAWAANPVDRFVYAGLAAKGLEPSPPADRRVLIRRVTFDLTGLPPTPEEVEAFLADESTDAFETVVDRLLASPRYGERWGRHWLDVVRFGESNGFERNVLINNAWPFRDYVIRSFNDDKPFDRLVAEHLAGDALAPGDPDVAVGTAFLVCGPYDNVGNQDPAQAARIRAETLDEVVRAAGEAFLGVTVGCARCHDHKFDPIPTADYYALSAVFAGVHHGSRAIITPEARRDLDARRAPLAAERDRLTGERKALLDAVLARAEAGAAEAEARWTRPPADRYGTEDAFPPVEAKYVRLAVASRDDNPDHRAGFQVDEFEVWTAGEAARNVALAANGGRADGASRVAGDFAGAYGPELTIDGRLGARWIAAGPTLTVTLARPERIGRVVFSSDRARSLGRDHGHTVFVGDYAIETSLDGESWTEVASSADRKPHSPRHREKRLRDAAITPEEAGTLARLDADLARANAELAALPEPPDWWVGEFRPAAGPFHVFVGGDAGKPGPSVTPASPSFPESVPGFDLPADSPEADRRLALARWITAPENPLTPRVLANRVWHYHFGTGIVDTPSDFGFMGGRPTHPELLDWLARRLVAEGWRLKPLHRLILTSSAYRQASTFRPEAAAVDGGSRLLWRFPPRRLSAEEVRDAMLAVAGALDGRMGGPGFRLYQYLEDNVATYVPLDRPGPETYRRAVYHQNARAARVDLLTEFDCPDVATATPRRAATTSPLQALTLLNHAFTLDMAAALADRLAREAGDDPGARVDRAFRLAFGRPPSPEEREAAVRLIGRHGPDALGRALFNANEFLFLD